MSETYQLWLTIAVGIGALSLLIQAVCILGAYSKFKEMQERFNAFLPKAEATLANAEKTMNEGRQQIHQATTRANELITKGTELIEKGNGVVQTAQTQLVKVNSFVDDTTRRARVQLDNIEGLLDDSVNRVKHTVGMVNDTVTWPVREMNAVASGLRAAAGAFFNKRKRGFREDESEPSNNHHETISR